MATDHRDHTVCGICNVSFYVCHKYVHDKKIETTNPGNKFIGAAYDIGSLDHHEVRDNMTVKVLVKKRLDQTQPRPEEDWSTLQHFEGEDHFLSHSMPIARSPYRTNPYTIVVGIAFHQSCLAIFRKVSLQKTGRFIWAGLYDLGIKNNHAGFRSVQREVASSSNHAFNHMTGLNTWIHVPGTQWVAASPFSVHYPIQSAYYKRSSGNDPREQVFSGDYRLDVRSTGAGEVKHWAPRVNTWRHNINLQARAPGIGTGKLKAVDVFVKKRPFSALRTPVGSARVGAGPSSRAPTGSALMTSPSNIPANNILTPLTTHANPPLPSLSPLPPPPPPPSAPAPAPATGRDLFSPIAAELLLMILDSLPAEDVASLRLVGRSFAEIPMRHFKNRIFREMPWAWELFGPDGKILPPPPGMAIDYKEMYRLVRRTLGSGFGAIQGMRNRQRIWGYCERILEVIDEGRGGG